MHLAFQPQKACVSIDGPEPLLLADGESEGLSTLFLVAAHGGLVLPKPLTHLFPRLEPEQAIQACQQVEVDQ